MSPRTVMHPILLITIALVTAVAPLRDLAAQEKKAAAATQEQIDRAIERGVRWLVRAQEVDGSWKGPYPETYRAGMTGLALYALLKTGKPADHRVIRKGLAFMNAQPCVATYEIGTNLLTYSALPPSDRPAKRIKDLAAILVNTLDDEGWRYNRPDNNVIDLSNGQYAMLGLRAAAAMGERVPTEIWRRAADIYSRHQQAYGGWGYKYDDAWSDAGMTCAGIFCLATCREQLADEKTARILGHNLKGRIDLGLSWLEKNWSVTENTAVDHEGGPRAQWLYHYLYGLERVGALAGVDLIGGHDWYEEGAAFLVGKQGARGAWNTPWGERDVSTSLVLLFLARGTRSTSVAPRPPMAVGGEGADTLVVRTNGENPLVAWVLKLEQKVEKRLAEGQRITHLIWEIDGAEVERVAVPDVLDIRDETTFLRHPITKNGEHLLRARVLFANPEGDPAGEEASAPMSLFVDDVEEPGDHEAMEDLAANRLTGVALTATSSSCLNAGWAARKIADGLQATGWLCADEDPKPWVEIRLEKQVAARVLKLTGASDTGDPDDDWARPKDIDVIVNNEKKISVTLPDDVRRKHAIDLGRMRVRQIRINVKSSHPGKQNATRVGFKEIELFK